MFKRVFGHEIPDNCAAVIKRDGNYEVVVGPALSWTQPEYRTLTQIKGNTIRTDISYLSSDLKYLIQAEFTIVGTYNTVKILENIRKLAASDIYTAVKVWKIIYIPAIKSRLTSLLADGFPNYEELYKSIPKIEEQVTLALKHEYTSRPLYTLHSFEKKYDAHRFSDIIDIERVILTDLSITKNLEN